MCPCRCALEAGKHLGREPSPTYRDCEPPKLSQLRARWVAARCPGAARHVTRWTNAGRFGRTRRTTGAGRGVRCGLETRRCGRLSRYFRARNWRGQSVAWRSGTGCRIARRKPNGSQSGRCRRHCVGTAGLRNASRRGSRSRRRSCHGWR